MPGFPEYDAALIERLDEQTAKNSRRLRRPVLRAVEPPILQPRKFFSTVPARDPPPHLRAGPIRRPYFAFVPTSPFRSAEMHLSGGKKFPPACLSWACVRFQPGEPERPSQFCRPVSSAWVSAIRKAADIEVLRPCGGGRAPRGLKSFSLKIGDLTLFAGLIDVLDIPAQWRGRLKRHFWRPAYFRELLERLSNGARPARGTSPISETGQRSRGTGALTGLMEYFGARRWAGARERRSSTG